MSPTIAPAYDAVLYLDTANAVAFQPPRSIEIDGEMGIEKAPLASFVRLNSCLLELYRNTLWPTAVFGEFLNAARQAFAFSMELQMNWLNLLAPHGKQYLATASISGRQAEPAEALARSMDIAIGTRTA